MFVIIFILCVVLLIWLLWKCKPLSKDTILLLTGEPGSGKTSTGLDMAIKSLHIKRVRWWFKHLFNKNLEKPQLYSNIPLANIEYKEFTLAHLRREVRFEYDSVIFLNEASLIADSRLAYNIGKDEARKLAVDQMQLFMKLIRHELIGKGICMVLDTQNPNDLCVAGDRCLNSMTWLCGHIDFIPFFRVIKYRKMIINVEGISNEFQGNMDENTSWTLVPKSIFKKYNSYCYEMLTHDKEIIGEPLKFKARRKKEIRKFRNLRFKIPTVTRYNELLNWNENLEKEGVKNEKGQIC